MSEETNKIILTNIQESVKEINDKLDKMTTNVSCLREDFIRHDEQIKIIKERNDKKDIQLATVMAENESAHNVLSDKTDKLYKQQWIWTGAIAVIVFVAWYIIPLFLKK